jgi:hypothetical protein
MNPLKILVLATWLFAAACFFVAPESTLAGLGRGLFWFLLVVHVIECAVFFPKLQRAPGSLIGHLGQTLVFGIVHARDLEPAAESEGA